jgi:hypothetical protein
MLETSAPRRLFFLNDCPLSLYSDCCKKKKKCCKKYKEGKRCKKCPGRK